MPNERKTEDLVRQALRNLGYYAKPISVEEQQSDDKRIAKLLKLASKNGPAIGRPEFIISSSQHSDFLVVIECKAEASRHRSEKLDRPAEFAVDGALHYAAFLAKEFDVLAIGVSGENARSLNISHFLQLKGSRTGSAIFGNDLLPYGDYYSGYISDPAKLSEDYQKLLGYSRDLNESLHAKKVKESQRSLLISGILIALQNKAFRSSYREHEKAERIATSLINTIIDQLSDDELPPPKLALLRHSFGFIKTHSTLSRDRKFFVELIDGIDEHLNSFTRTHRYHDTLGQFYIEFLRYANNDKGLGIVLTPPHITELFCMLANVNKDSVVVDNTCGTGGFLISAMRLMVEDARGDKTKIKKIQQNQLLGVEYQDDIYALAVTNMVLHGDGKTNIRQGDCFTLAEQIKEKCEANVGLLNPPYKTNKSDIEELDYVLNNVDMLVRGGTCAAIVPISSVLAQSGIGRDLKDKLLTKHTLEAVLSMPPELFHNSKVGVVTSALVLTAHIPHPKDKKTWFAYCREDGFVKTKHRGRIDLRNQWASIRDRWIQSFRNREVVAGFSVAKAVTGADEWCAEAYMETDYSRLTPAMFEETVRRYALFRLMGQNQQGITPQDQYASAE